MKKKFSSMPTLRVWFTLICMVEYIVVALLAELTAWLIKKWLGITVAAPLFVWAVLFSVIFGFVITNFTLKVFFDPVAKLEKAMRTVAGGNFKVTAETDSRINEVRSLYSSFNMMVKELSATETLQTDFISSVSHEFKTPINAIEGYASLLQDHQQSQEEQDAYIEKILFNTRRLSTLIGNILLLSKISAQSIRPQLVSYRLDEQVRQAIVALEQKWTEKDIDFDIELDEIEYSGYGSLLIHVWTNLIDNAIKFDPHGGMILMRMRAENDTVTFTIEDDGPGIPAGDEERIFHKFYQSDNSREMYGNGLGLALAQQIVELSGGTISVENLPTEGCRFTVRLPIVAKQ